MRKQWLVSFALVGISLFQFNCSGCGGGADDEEIKFIPEDDLSCSSVSYNSDAMNEVIGSFSSPVEMAALLKASGVPFSTKYLSDPDKLRDTPSSFKKALGLGILSADLGYLNVYSKTSQILDYLVSIRQLTEDLKLGQFFDFQTLKRLTTSEDNLDSLMFMCTQSYHNMDEHLRENQRSNLSALLVTGVWLESLYLLTQVEKEHHSDELKDAIGEQKVILSSLLTILRNFKENDKNFEKLVQYLEEINDVFAVVNISVHVRDDAGVSDEGVIVQNEYSVVVVSNEELLEIISVTERIRQSIISDF